MNRTDDIPGSLPRHLHQSHDKPYYYLTNEDIAGSQPAHHKFVTVRQPTNPLEPVYKLPYAEIRISTPPKFIRESMNIKDIDGAHPRSKLKAEIAQRKSMVIEDIPGAHVKKAKTVHPLLSTSS